MSVQPKVITISARGRRETLEILRAQVVLIRAALLSYRRYMIANMDAWLEAARNGYFSAYSTHTVIDPDRVKQIQEVMTASKLAGGLQIRQVAHAAGIEEAAMFSEIFPVDAPPAKAIDWLKGLPTVTREKWEATMAAYQQPAFFISGIEQRQTLAVIQKALQESLEKGWTLLEFEREIRAQLNELSLSGGRLRNIWHNNVTNAFTAGRREEMERPEIKAVLPFYLFDALVDGVVRSNHAALDNGIAPVDWDGWERYRPMLGFNCRCSLISVTAGRAHKMLDSGEAWDMTLGVPLGAGPDLNYVRMA